MWLHANLLLRIWVDIQFSFNLILPLEQTPCLNFREDCCQDYTSLCGIHNIEPRMDSVPWPPMGFVLAGLLAVMAATASLILLLGRRRSRGLDREEEESVFSDDEERRRGVGRVVMVEGDCGETIDFRLSTTESQPCELGPCQMYTTI